MLLLVFSLCSNRSLTNELLEIRVEETQEEIRLNGHSGQPGVPCDVLEALLQGGEQGLQGPSVLREIRGMTLPALSLL